MNSTFGKLNWMDIGKGFLLAILAALITGVYQALQAGTISFTWAFFQPIVLSSVGAGLAYLIKNFFTNSQGTPLAKEK
jgi:hypothetical protein